MEQEQYSCPACAGEGKPEPQPATNFYWLRTKPTRDEQGRIIAEYKDDTRRSPLCKKHTNKATTEWKRRRLDPTSPDYDPKAREKLQTRQQKYENEVRKKGGPRYKKRVRKPKPKGE